MRARFGVSSTSTSQEIILTAEEAVAAVVAAHVENSGYSVFRFRVEPTVSQIMLP